MECPGARRTAPARSSECACASVRNWASSRNGTCYTTRPFVRDCPTRPVAAAVPSPTRRRSILVLKAVISIGLLGLLLSSVDLARLWATARTASPAWMCLALALYAVMCLLSAWRWRVLLRAQNVPLSFRALTASFLVATFFNNFLPSNIGGDVVRIGDTARAAGSKTLAATVVLLDRAIGLVGP